MLAARREDLLELLRRANRPVSKSALANHLAVSQRTVSRYINELIRDGVQIARTQVGANVRFQLKSHFISNGQWFTAETVRAFGLMLELVEQLGNKALHSECQPLVNEIKKLTKSAVGSADLQDKIIIKTLAQRPVDASLMADITRALTQRVKITISYLSRGDNIVSSRIISPQQLELYRNNWYLLGWCHKQRDYRYFALERIQQVQLSQQPADPEKAPPSLRGYGIFDLAANKTATLHFSARRAKWVAEEVWHAEQEDQLLADGSLIRKFPYGVDVELVRDLMREGADVSVQAPTSLRRAVDEGHKRALENQNVAAKNAVPKAKKNRGYL